MLSPQFWRSLSHALFISLRTFTGCFFVIRLCCVCVFVFWWAAFVSAVLCCFIYFLSPFKLRAVKYWDATRVPPSAPSPHSFIVYLAIQYNKTTFVFKSKRTERTRRKLKSESLAILSNNSYGKEQCSKRTENSKTIEKKPAKGPHTNKQKIKKTYHTLTQKPPKTTTTQRKQNQQHKQLITNSKHIFCSKRTREDKQKVENV